MKDETEIRERREEIVELLKESDGGSIEWHKWEAMEVALDWVVEDNDILTNTVESHNE